MQQQILPMAEVIEVQSLPYVPIGERQLLPAMPGIYFVLNKQGDVCYIGRAQHIRNRWIDHHQLPRYTNSNVYRIAWLLVSDATLLPRIEKACIAYFHPSDNGQRPEQGTQSLTANLPHAIKRRFLAALALRGETFTHWLLTAILAYLRACDKEERRVIEHAASKETPHE